MAVLAPLLACSLSVGAEAAGSHLSGDYSTLPPIRVIDPALQRQLDASSARIEALSRALGAAVGDVEEYAQLRAEHDAEVRTYDSLILLSR